MWMFSLLINLCYNDFFSIIIALFVICTYRCCNRIYLSLNNLKNLGICFEMYVYYANNSILTGI